MRVVLLTWNVHSWVGRDRVRDPGRSFDLIRSQEADVVALQETEGWDWEGVARTHGYVPFVGRTRPIRFGNVLLVRDSVERIRRLDLSVPGREPRGALDAVIALRGHELRVMATHLGLRAWERRLQAIRLAHHLDERDTHLPTVLMGDLNDWTRQGRQLRPLTERVGPLSRISTFPSWQPLLALDRAACRPPRLSTRMQAVRCGDARTASDHLPLRIELELAEPRLSA